jgi:hypothetical protein
VLEIGTRYVMEYSFMPFFIFGFQLAENTLENLKKERIEIDPTKHEIKNSHNCS